MALTFYWGSGSPVSWRVMLALEHKEARYESRMLSFAKREQRSEEFLAVNPRGLVPAIVDDGFALWESAAIVEYLDARFTSGTPLFPRDAQRAAVVRRLVQEIDQYIAPASMRLGRQIWMRKAEERDEKEVSDAREKMLAELAMFEKTLEATGGFLAETLSAADYTLYPYLGSQCRMAATAPTQAIFADVGPAVRAWMARVEALPFFARTVPPHWR